MIHSYYENKLELFVYIIRELKHLSNVMIKSTEFWIVVVSEIQ